VALAIPLAIATPAFGAMQPSRPMLAPPSTAPAEHQPKAQYPSLSEPAPDSLFEIRGRNRLVGSWMPSEDVVVGVGLYRVQKIGRNDPNRNNPLHDAFGKTQRVPAVGVSLSF